MCTCPNHFEADDGVVETLDPNEVRAQSGNAKSLTSTQILWSLVPKFEGE